MDAQYFSDLASLQIAFQTEEAAWPSLLYLHARTPSVFSPILGYTLIEPVRGYQTEISAGEFECLYKTVHDAMVDGWQVVQFPHLQAPFDDTDLDVVGYEFILQKIHAYPSAA